MLRWIHAQKGDDVLTITTNDTEAVFEWFGYLPDVSR